MLSVPLDVVLANSNPDVLDMINISKRICLENETKPLVWQAITSLLFLLQQVAFYPFTGIYIDPLIAAVLMSISTVIVAINAMGLGMIKIEEHMLFSIFYHTNYRNFIT